MSPRGAPGVSGNRTAVMAECTGIERVLGRLLAARGLTVAVAESCTGGLIGGRITAVSGSSAWFAGGVIAYSNGVKERLLGVPRALLQRAGAVSEPVARRMAAGARRRLGTDYALAVTGVAGPGGGTRRKPVGLVFAAAAGPRGCTARRYRFRGGRAAVRRACVQAALRLLAQCVEAKET